MVVREKAPTTPAVLKKNGIKFALYSDGLDAPRDLQRAIKKAIDNGLFPRGRFAALTLSPAEIYGVQDRLGSIEKGKIANLVVTKGEIFDDRTKIEFVLVDGNKYVPGAGTTSGWTWRRNRANRSEWSQEIMKRVFLAGLIVLSPLGAEVTVIQNATL